MGFDSFLGNGAAVASVRSMLVRRAMPGALLFAGPDGVGKKTLAMMLAKALECERLTDDFCGACPRCHRVEEMLNLAAEDLARRREIKDASRRVDGLVYFDSQLIEPLTRFILIEQIRELRRVAYGRPFELAHRVFIVDQAQAIHWQAADLLLKVMEEPPPDTCIILICTNPYELRPTLRSRCQHVPFLPVEDEQIEALLRAERQTPAAQLALAVRVAGGSVAAARSLDLAEFERRRKPWIDFLTSVTVKRTGDMGAAHWKLLFDSARALAEDRRRQEDVFGLGYSLLSDVLNVLEHPIRPRIVNVDLEPQLQRWAAALGLRGIARLKDALDEARRLETRNVNQQLGWEALAVEMLDRA